MFDGQSAPCLLKGLLQCSCACPSAPSGTRRLRTLLTLAWQQSGQVLVEVRHQRPQHMHQHHTLAQGLPDQLQPRRSYAVEATEQPRKQQLVTRLQRCLRITSSCPSPRRVPAATIDKVRRHRPAIAVSAVLPKIFSPHPVASVTLSQRSAAR